MNWFCLKVLETEYQWFETNQTLFLKNEFKNGNLDQKWTRLGDFICSKGKQKNETWKCIDFDTKGEDKITENFKTQAFVSNRTFKTNQKWILRPSTYIAPSNNLTFYLFLHSSSLIFYRNQIFCYCKWVD